MRWKQSFIFKKHFKKARKMTPKWIVKGTVVKMRIPLIFPGKLVQWILRNNSNWKCDSDSCHFLTAAGKLSLPPTGLFSSIVAQSPPQAHFILPLLITDFLSINYRVHSFPCWVWNREWELSLEQKPQILLSTKDIQGQGHVRQRDTFFPFQENLCEIKMTQTFLLVP